ncbi:MAG: hypothetical protein QW756_04240 [Nitrososphaerota archaeon]
MSYAYIAWAQVKLRTDVMAGEARLETENWDFAQRLSRRRLVKALMRMYLEGPLKPPELGLTGREVAELIELELCTRSRYLDITLKGEMFLEKSAKMPILKHLRREQTVSHLADLLRVGEVFPLDSGYLNKLRLAGCMMRSRGHREIDFTWLTEQDIQILKGISHGMRFPRPAVERLLDTGLVDSLAKTEHLKVTRLGEDFLKCLNQVERLYRSVRAVHVCGNGERLRTFETKEVRS